MLCDRLAEGVLPLCMRLGEQRRRKHCSVATRIRDCGLFESECHLRRATQERDNRRTLMIVGERFLRNKIPETLKSDCLNAQRGGSRVVVPAGSRLRGGLVTPLLSGSTKSNQQTEDEFCRSRSSRGCDSNWTVMERVP
jgi:hypothetical protein